jgi:ATP-dependent DNA helicase RecG
MSEIFDYLNLTIGNKATVALVLCFAKDPSKYLPHFAVKFGALSSDQFAIENLVFQTEIKKPLLRVIEETQGHYIRYLPKKIYLKGFERVEMPVIPTSALREFTMNAIMHADYSIPSPIYIIVAKTYVEISNPGESLIRPIERLYEKHRSLARNPKVANVFFLAGYVDRWGEGINNAIRYLLEESLPFPSLTEENSFFTVKIFIESDEIMGRIIPMLKTPKRTTELAKELGISERLVRSKLSLLKKRGVIQKIRKGKKIFYIATGETAA